MGANRKQVLLDNSETRRLDVEGVLTSDGYQVVASVPANAPLLRLVEELTPEVIVIVFNYPEAELFQALSAVNRFAPCASVLFAEDGAQETIEQAVAAGINSYVVAGLEPERVSAIVGVALARFRRYQKLIEELDSARQDLAARKLIERAKGIIMERGKQNENDAYHAIRKLAMNENKTMAEIARSLISTAELLN